LTGLSLVPQVRWKQPFSVVVAFVVAVSLVSAGVYGSGSQGFGLELELASLLLMGVALVALAKHLRTKRTVSTAASEARVARRPIG
jgi:hypothetical protein